MPYNEENLEKILRLQEEGDEDFFKVFPLLDTSFMEWATRVQRRFSEVLDEKETYLADISALPYPESWILFSFKVQAFRAIRMGENSILPHIAHGLEHLATFLDLKLPDRANLATVERYREELKGITPGEKEESFFLSDGKTLKEVLRSYGQALPTFNRYHEKVEDRKKAYRREFQVFCDEMRKLSAE